MKGDIIKGAKGDWEIVIGIETHAQLIAESKLFSAASTNFGAEQNSNVSFIDAAMPGSLPMSINEKCVKNAIRAGLALNCKIAQKSVFDRKNYFYPDSPKGYQISQYYKPIAIEGELKISDDFSVRINRIHIEEDAGKSVHDIDPSRTFIDMNRVGVGLIEIVTEPDMRAADEACAYVKALRSILRYIDVCDGNMECGSMRCDVNISVRPVGSADFGDRVEIKNINSVKHIKAAIIFESQRQVELLEAGERIEVETRLFDADTNTTRAMRKKEGVADYRYFPEPNLLPLILEADYIDEVRASMSELPEAKRRRYVQDYGLSDYDAEILTAEKGTALYFEEVLSIIDRPKLIANWICGELFKNLNRLSVEIDNNPLKPSEIAALIVMIDEQKISGSSAKKVLELMFDEGASAEFIVRKYDLAQNSDESEIDSLVAEVLKGNLAEVERYRAGEQKLFGFFVGQVMKVSKGKANPDAVNKSLRSALGS